MAFTLSNFSNALHNILLPYIRDNFPKQTILLDQMKRNNGTTFLNNNFYAPLRSSRHGGVTSLANDGNSTVSGQASLLQASIGVKILTGAFDISKLAIDATSSSKSAVENALTFQATSLTSDFSRTINRQMFSDGVGVVAQVLTSGGSVGVGTISVKPLDANVDDGRTTDHYGTVNGDISPVKYLAPGMVIGVGTAAAAVGTVVSISAGSTTGTIVTSAAIVTNAEDSIYILDGSGAGAGTAEATGIAAALSSSTGTSTYAGVARNTVGWAPQFGSTSEALTLTRMENSYLGAKEYGQMGDTYAIFVNRTLYRKYGDLLTSMRRSVDQTDLLGGWTGLEFAVGAGKVGVFLDYDVPDGEVLILNMDSWTLCQVSDMNWMESPNEGSMLRIAQKITYQATMTWFWNMLCLAPAANGRETQKTG